MYSSAYIFFWISSMLRGTFLLPFSSFRADFKPASSRVSIAARFGAASTCYHSTGKGSTLRVRKGSITRKWRFITLYATVHQHLILIRLISLLPWPAGGKDSRQQQDVHWLHHFDFCPHQSKGLSITTHTVEEPIGVDQSVHFWWLSRSSLSSKPWG